MEVASLNPEPASPDRSQFIAQPRPGVSSAPRPLSKRRPWRMSGQQPPEAGVTVRGPPPSPRGQSPRRLGQVTPPRRPGESPHPSTSLAIRQETPTRYIKVLKHSLSLHSLCNFKLLKPLIDTTLNMEPINSVNTTRPTAKSLHWGTFILIHKISAPISIHDMRHETHPCNECCLLTYYYHEWFRRDQ